MLSNHDAHQPIYFGHNMEMNYIDRRNDPQGLQYVSGGGRYVLSQEALKIIVTRGIRTQKPCWTPGGAEDAAVGRCMGRLGVSLGSSQDITGRELLHPFSLASHLFGGFPEWYTAYKKDHKQVHVFINTFITHRPICFQWKCPYYSQEVERCPLQNKTYWGDRFGKRVYVLVCCYTVHIPI